LSSKGVWQQFHQVRCPGLQSATVNVTILAGHWSALGLHVTPNFVGLDSGCAWGNLSTALRLEDHQIFQVPCETLFRLVE
jgi:bis(5'-nucleosyl)-tetraphosphatase (symmetrical)